MAKEDEKILVVSSEVVFKNGAWQGFSTDFPEWLTSSILENKRFERRGNVEEDPSFKQIIPYVVFKVGDQLFLMQRRPDHTDERLASKYSIGISGHLREDDLVSENPIEWGKREFWEEVEYDKEPTFSVIGCVYDESDAVGGVHMGIVILAQGSSPNIRIKHEHIEGKLLPLQEVKKFRDLMENWSKFVFDFLVEQAGSESTLSHTHLHTPGVC